MSILDVEKREEEGIELSGIILICILLLSSVPYSMPVASGVGSHYCRCGIRNCNLDVRNCGHDPCPYADDPCSCGCGISRRYCPAGECGSTPDTRCPNAPCKPGSCPGIPVGQLCAAIRCTCQGVACDATIKTVTNCPCEKIKCGCRTSWTWKCDSSGDCKVSSCHCGCSKPISGPGKCGHGQCGERAQEGCELYCKCACGNNIIECGGQQCGSPQTPKPGCPSYDRYCECRCGKPVAECGRQCGGSPIPGCSAYIEICRCGCKDDVETCRGGQCGSKPKTGCINYVENCNCGCKKTAKECPEGQCGDEPKPACPSSKEVCGCPCKNLTNRCGGGQCGTLPMPGCPQYSKECSCSCGQSILDCGQQCGATPKIGCRARCACICGLPTATCGAGQCNDTPNKGCEKWTPSFMERIEDGYWQPDNPLWKDHKGRKVSILGVHPPKDPLPTGYGRGQAGIPPGSTQGAPPEAGGEVGIKWVVNPSVAKIPLPIDDAYVTAIGAELGPRITNKFVGVRGLGYLLKGEINLDFVPVIGPAVGKYVKGSVYCGSAGAKFGLDFSKGRVELGGAAGLGGGIEVNFGQAIVDAYKWLTG